MMQKDGEDSSTRRGREIEQANLRWRDKERKLRDDIHVGALVGGDEWCEEEDRWCECWKRQSNGNQMPP